MKLKLSDKQGPAMAVVCLLFVLGLVAFSAATGTWHPFGLTTGSQFGFRGNGWIRREAPLAPAYKRLTSSTFRGSQGYLVAVTYSIEVEEGSVYLWVATRESWWGFARYDSPWHVTIRETTVGEATVELPDRMRYEIKATLYDFKGTVKIAYRTERP